MPFPLPAHWTLLPRDFYRRHPTEVAPQLLNRILVRDDGRAGRIVEVEAYAGSEDPAAHSHRGPTRRNATMFGEPGHLYVYFTYGMHWGSNAVCGDVGEGAGVLLRAIEPLQGLDLIRAARPGARRDRDLANGPGKLSQAMGITGDFDGADLVAPDRGIAIVDDGTPPPATPAVGPRIGISQAIDFHWRWHVPGHPHVPRWRPHPSAPRKRRTPPE
ncbi:DNA-3-methyladenine glycosylase [Luteimonas sp. YGD11-2]|uniref:DNA-3-methyladenine glycosylase n=1 Tax=Luteimonas sp. YGD11-2 TaxID=2508168 RepID=UPI00100B0328|nr:DNA-3-methyladenine glycosylase [Luteimonas sp. YGD11-2]